MSRTARYACIVFLLGACVPAAAQFNPFGPVSHVASGGQHSCAIDNDGQLHCWGFNAAGQLGIGSLESQLHPTPVALASDAVAVTLGQNHSCAITASGSTYCWGWNSFGQVGTGSGGDRLSPALISELGAAAVDISAGDRHTCAVLSSGNAKCWGRNNTGELGNGDPGLLSRNRPVDVADLADAVRIAAGTNHTCALRSNGDVSCWGSRFGLGTGGDTATNRPGDRAVLPLPAIDVVSGLDRSCAVLIDGRVFCWGGDTAPPAEVEGLPDSVADIALGDMHVCALTDGGEVYCWGSSTYGEAGYAAESRIDSATLLPLDEPTASLSAGTDITCARAVSGKVRCWGRNTWGQTGSGSAAIALNPRRAAASLGSMSRFHAGAGMSCAITQTGQLWCAGVNGRGQAGTGSYSIASPLAPVSGGVQAAAVVPGGSHTCALSTDGAVYCWGYNWSGQLGYSGAGEALPRIVSAIAAPVTHIDTALSHTCAVTSAQAWCWGNNASGQLGRGDSAPPASAQPAPVLGLPDDVVQVSTASSHSCSVTAQGAAYCWGSNADGKLGDGTLLPRRTAVGVLTLESGVKQVSAGNVHTCAVKFDGSAWCWGNSLYGALGNGGTIRRLTPERVIAVESPYVSISAGHYFTCATTEQGDVYCFGYNAQGQLGIGSTTSDPRPQRVNTTGGPAVRVTTGSDHACAIDAQGEASCWGMGQFGQLANGAPDWSQPQLVVVVDPIIFISGFE